ncbi:MAG TPA: DMT family transporter [Gemmataceae bacterium]|nr:DMT family transporter [Gemmataceae bacterium]
MTHHSSRPFVWMLCGSFTFTLMAELAYELNHVSRKCDWQTVAVFRAALVAVFAGIMAKLAGAKLVFWPWRLWVRSVAGSLSMVCTFYTFAKLPSSSDVVTLTNTFPIWVAVLSWPLYRKAPGAKMWLAIFLGIAGVVLVEQPHLEAGNLGVYTALAAALFTAVAMLGLHSLSGLDPRAIVVHFSAVGTVFCGVAWAIGPRTHPMSNVLELGVLWKLIGLGVTATIGQIFLTLAFRGGAPAKVSVVGLSQIVFALAFDAWLWNRGVNAVALVGTALVIAPTAWLLLQPKPGKTKPGLVVPAEPTEPVTDAPSELSLKP